MEERILFWLHAQSHPALDVAFRVSHELATQGFCAALVVVMIVFHWRRADRPAAFLWLGLGLTTLLLDLSLKPLFGRVRPALWDGPLDHSSYSLPSGHALASATFYTVLAWSLSRRHPSWGRWAYLAAAALAFYIGIGRLYLGVHWPTDVLAGWTLGVAQTVLAIRLARIPPPVRA